MATLLLEIPNENCGVPGISRAFIIENSGLVDYKVNQADATDPGGIDQITVTGAGFVKLKFQADKSRYVSPGIEGADGSVTSFEPLFTWETLQMDNDSRHSFERLQDCMRCGGTLFFFDENENWRVLGIGGRIKTQPGSSTDTYLVVDELNVMKLKAHTVTIEQDGSGRAFQEASIGGVTKVQPRIFTGSSLPVGVS